MRQTRILSCALKISTDALPPVTLKEVTASRFRQFKKPTDIVSQFAHLARTSSESDLWDDLAATVTQSVSKLRGDDIASILRSCAKTGYRDPLMLTAVCESLKTLPTLRLVRVRDIATILSSFHSVNFVPSVEVLNALSGEVRRSLSLYRTNSRDLCLLFRYFSIIADNPLLVINYDSEFANHQIVSELESAIEGRIGSFGALEICVITKYTKRMTLKNLIENFTRSENVSPVVLSSFIRNLDARFGSNVWKEYSHLFRMSKVDSTGWNRQPMIDEDSDDDDVVSTEGPKKFDRFKLEDALVAEVLMSINGSRSGISNRKTKKDMKEETIPSLTDQQLDFLRELEEELGVTSPPKRDAFTDHADRNLVRAIEESDIAQKKLSPELYGMKKFKERRNRRLFKFAVLSCMQRKARS